VLPPLPALVPVADVPAAAELLEDEPLVPLPPLPPPLAPPDADPFWFRSASEPHPQNARVRANASAAGRGFLKMLSSNP
jgi:hypothetical protein